MTHLKDFSHLSIKPGKSTRLTHFSSDSTRHVPNRDKAETLTDAATLRIGELQEALYAECRQSLLVVLQGMDASGKDGTVRKVFDDVNPTGVQVVSFKQPSAEELRHDFLWRCHQKVPPHGYIGVFNRSYYEDVLVVRVHADQLLPLSLRDDPKLWDRRFRMINDFERALSDTGTRILKFYLHISRDEQRERFIARQEDPAKHWKLAAGDFEERKYWDGYQLAYEKMLTATNTQTAPWHIIPADHKWVRNYFVSQVIAAALNEMNPKPPELIDKSLASRRFK